MKTLLTLLVGLLLVVSSEAQTVRIGSKVFTESYVLGEIAEQLLEPLVDRAEHRQGMGGTIILWQALKGGSIDIYPEYTGTILEAILGDEERLIAAEEELSLDQMRRLLAPYGVGISDPLGFNNTYAVAMTEARASELGIVTISDLRDHPELIAGMSPEFLGRQDGWEPLVARYRLPQQNVRAIEHSLGYRALETGQIDLIDVYSTDAKIAELGLRVLEDDLQFFPLYEAVWLYRLNLPEEVIAALYSTADTIPESLMVEMNARAEATEDYRAGAQLYFAALAAEAGEDFVERESRSTADRVLGHTLRHLQLVGISMLLAISIGIPLGVFASRPGNFSRIVLGVVGMIQTIPSLALLALFVAMPFLGISLTTAILALFLYSLLPIVRNTAAGIANIDPAIREVATAVGLPAGARMRKVFLPLASPTILAGIKTSTVINIGTATLAAFIGAGGLGEPIWSGIQLNSPNLILQGALPAAGLAFLAEGLFYLFDRTLIPRGLRLT